MSHHRASSGLGAHPASFTRKLNGHLADRTQRLGKDLLNRLIEGGLDAVQALAVAENIAAVFGKLKKGKEAGEAFIEQLAFISPEERTKAMALADRALAEIQAGQEFTKVVANNILQTADTAADIAMFGRMLADTPKFNREAAVQVSHAITTHRGGPEDDYYVAVDDLKSRSEPDDAGAGFVGVQEFGAGVFYLYICIDRGLLLRSLQNTMSLRNASIRALVEAAATVAPKGMQASFASRAHAFYILGERGCGEPCSLTAAFLSPIRGNDQGKDSIAALKDFRNRLDTAYGRNVEERYTLNTEPNGEGTLAELLDFAVK